MIPYGKHHIDEEDIQAVVDVLRSGVLTQGPVIEAFEQAVAAYVEAKYAVAVSSATAALHLAAIVAGVGPGKTLITSPITFVASANAGLYAGGEVAFADIDPTTVNMSPASLKLALERNPNTKAVVPVHFAGLPCDMPAIKKLADDAGAVVIEDAAHALGASYPDGRRIGCCAHSLMTIFSFHPVKSIATGEGGMVVTNNADVYRHLIRLRSHGINKSDDKFLQNSLAFTNEVQNPWYYEMQELGFHYRITDIQSALGLSQLKKLDAFISRRRELAKRYDDTFVGTRFIRPAQMMGLERSAHHIYPVRINFAGAGISRTIYMKQLRQHGIMAQVHYIPVTMQPFYRARGSVMTAYPHANAYYEETLSIPIYFDLSDEQQDLVISLLQELLK
jgi:perosamine synthetase